MAVVRSNVVTKGLSGKFGNDIVFRQWNGKTFASAPPISGDRELSESQIEHRKRFRLAALYAKSAMAVPETKALYEAIVDKRGFKSAFNAAISDFFNSPEILEIELNGYKGAVGDVIPVKVSDDFKVSRVILEIYQVDGTSVENGNAALSSDGVIWNYIVKAENNTLVDSRVVVKAYDLPGNFSQSEVILQSAETSPNF